MSPPTPIPANTNRSKYITDFSLALLGTLLLISPIITIMNTTPEQFTQLSLYLRIMVSVGAGLVGISITGFLHIEMPGIKAGGGLAVLVLVYTQDPLISTEEVPITNQHQPTDISQDTNTSLSKQQTTLHTNTAANPAIQPWKPIIQNSWLKTTNLIGKKVYIKIAPNISLWASEIDQTNQHACFIVNNSTAAPDYEPKYLNNECITISHTAPFTVGTDKYKIKLENIKPQGIFRTSAAYITILKQSK